MAQFIFQALQSLTCVNPSAKQGQQTVQQAQTIMERLETAVKKVLDSLRTTVGVGVRGKKIPRHCGKVTVSLFGPVEICYLILIVISRFVS